MYCLHLDTVICWLILYCAILCFSFSFIHDISHSVHFILAISHYIHTGYACAPFSHFYTHWEFWLLRFAYPGPCIFYLVDQVFEEDHMSYEEPEFPYLIVPSWYFLAFLFLFLPWFCILDSVLVLFLYSCAIIVLEIYMLYCSSYHVIIVD